MCGYHATMPYLLVANASSGSGSGDLATRARRELNDVRTIDLGPEVDLGPEIGQAIAEGRTIVACGGDGTVNATAQHLAGTDGVLGVLPDGTLNHFARDLGVRDPDTAIATLAEGRSVAIDVGRIGDRVFVNNVGLGVYPELVREREHREDSVGRWVAVIASVFQVMAHFDPLQGTFTTDGRMHRLAANALFVGNNRFSTSPGTIGRRERLDEGVLDVRLVRARTGVLGRASAGWRTAVSRPRRVMAVAARDVEIDLRRPRLVAMDGEQGDEEARLSVRSDPGALRVLVPAADEGT